MTPNQKHAEIRKIILLSPGQQATKAAIYDAATRWHRFYTMGNLGVLLTTMVKSGKIKRVKVGVYGMPNDFPTNLFQ